MKTTYVYPFKSHEVIELLDNQPITHTYGSISASYQNVPAIDALVACYLYYAKFKRNFNEIDVAACRAALEKEKRIIKRKDGKLYLQADETQSFWVKV